MRQALVVSPVRLERVCVCVCGLQEDVWGEVVERECFVCRQAEHALPS